ncbi:hypothetical protein DFH07DRAFT_979391 [Mycena maculata]|uniref:Uncharacterized protein n=1 Tax=Mycena maculata TaxID=230809 RepID=A0AAD7N2V2_9AGAR|nr:hypothetical protein DFH07DRAFT_979391 [Mycena maculata]
MSHYEKAIRNERMERTANNAPLIKKGASFETTHQSAKFKAGTTTYWIIGYCSEFGPAKVMQKTGGNRKEQSDMVYRRKWTAAPEDYNAAAFRDEERLPPMATDRPRRTRIGGKIRSQLAEPIANVSVVNEGLSRSALQRESAGERVWALNIEHPNAYHGQVGNISLFGDQDVEFWGAQPCPLKLQVRRLHIPPAAPAHMVNTSQGISNMSPLVQSGTVWAFENEGAWSSVFGVKEYKTIHGACPIQA